MLARELVRQIDELAIDFGGHGSLRQPPPDRLGKLLHAASIGQVFHASIGEFDRGHVSSE